jgi:hypothetical protein
MERKEKNRLIKFVKKHPTATTALMGAGLLATGMAMTPVAGVTPISAEVATSLFGQTLASGTETGIGAFLGGKAVVDYLEKRHSKKLKQVI